MDEVLPLPLKRVKTGRPRKHYNEAVDKKKKLHELDDMIVDFAGSPTSSDSMVYDYWCAMTLSVCLTTLSSQQAIMAFIGTSSDGGETPPDQEPPGQPARGQCSQSHCHNGCGQISARGDWHAW